MNRRRLLTRVIPAVVMVGMSITVPLVLAGGDVRHAITRGQITKPPKILSTTEVAYVGLEPTQVSNVNLGLGTWEMSFYLWWRWRGPIDPTGTTYVTNGTGASTSTSISYSFTNDKGQEQPKMLKDGWYYQQAYESLGFSDSFPMQRYPIDVQNLELRIENTSYDYNQLVYRVDPHASTDQGLTVPGWKTKQIVYGTYMHHYNTDFGNTDEGPAFHDYSLVTFDIVVSRPISHFLGKLLVPLFVVILGALSALFLKASNFDTRLALTGTGLLTLIFLQQGYAGDLPNPVPFVLMDKIYALAYAAVLVTFFRVVWATAVCTARRAASRSASRAIADWRSRSSWFSSLAQSCSSPSSDSTKPRPRRAAGALPLVTTGRWSCSRSSGPRRRWARAPAPCCRGHAP